MDQTDIECLLASLLVECQELDNPRVKSFEDSGIVSSDSGLVLRLKTGEEFQITIVQSRKAR